MNQKLPISEHLADVFHKLPKDLDANVAVLLVLSLEDDTQKTLSRVEQSWLDGVIAKYDLDDVNAVKKFIGNRFTHMLPDQKKSSLGKYYSPTGAIRLVRALLKGILHPSDLVLDICVGCGAFAFEFAGNEFYGFDIDPVAVQILKKMGFKLMVEMDSLACVDRARFDIPEDKRVVIVGNPPYNDRTSKNRRKSKSQVHAPMDARVDNQDSGVAFMRAYFLLKPRAVAVLHPLTYLLKPTLYGRLANFGYRLETCIIFSSRAFATHGSNAFPYAAALWLPRDLAAFEDGREQPKLTKEEITREFLQLQNQQFQVVEVIEDQTNVFEGHFRAADYRTIDCPACRINKYASDKTSDIGLYQFNFRDLNSLLSNGNLTSKMGDTAPVNLGTTGEDLFKYCALNAIKRYWKGGKKPFDFILGNLSPIYPKELIETPLKFACLIDVYFAHQQKFQPRIAKLRPWVYQLAKTNPDNNLLRRFACVLDGEDADREALKTHCAELVRKGVDGLR